MVAHGIIDDIAGRHQNAVCPQTASGGIDLFGRTSLGIDKQVRGCVAGPQFREDEATSVAIHGGNCTGAPGSHAGRCHQTVVDMILGGRVRIL